MTRQSRQEQVDRPRGALGASSLTPLLDTLFLLLFALLASSRRASMEPTAPTPEEVRVELPAVDPLESEAGAADTTLSLVVQIDSDGTVTLIGSEDATETSTTAELRSALEAEAASADGGVVVEIRADTDARHGVTVDVLQTIRSAGISDVRFVATTEATGDGERRFGAGGEDAR
ncbi:MAG: biopolymer transporter ExbD [Planctomycetota bacterium]